MHSNQRILDEIEARIKNAKASLPELPEALAPLLDYFESQSVAGIAHEMLEDVSTSLRYWCEGDFQAAGFEWYYDGSSVPRAMGYTYASASPAADFSLYDTVGCNTAEARADFNGGIALENMIDCDSGDLNVGKACFPVFECDVAELCDSDDDETMSAYINLFTLRMFKALHLVFQHLAATGVMGSLNVKENTAFFANNHDWSPFLLFIYEKSSSDQLFQSDQSLQSLEASGDAVPETLQSWADGIVELIDNKKKRKKLLSQVLRLPPAGLERNLLSLPILSDDKGNEMAFSNEDLRSFGFYPLCDPENYENIAFDAFAHYLNFALTYEDPNLYVLQVPLTTMFVRDPKKAYEHVSKILSDRPEHIENILDCAKNCVRWANEDYIDQRSPNPNLALSKSKEAQEALTRLNSD